MNERIKELISQAGNLSFNEAWNEEMPPVEYIICTSDSIYTAPFIEKFAELIVREVLDQVDEFSRLTKAYQKQGIDPEIDVTKEVLKNLGFPRFPRG